MLCRCSQDRNCVSPSHQEEDPVIQQQSLTYPQIASFEADTGLPFHLLVAVHIAVDHIVAVQIVVVHFAAQIGFEQTAVADLDQPVR